MARSKNAERDAREARERLRRYSARQTVHGKQVSRRRRDNVLGIAGAVVIAALATVTQVVYFTAGPGVPSPAPSDSASPSAAPNSETQNLGNVPDPSLAEGRTWTGTLTLNDVPLQISLDGSAAPQAVAVFVQEVKDRYFQGKSCHRLTAPPTALIQCGSLDGSGSPDPSFHFGPIENAPADKNYPAGTIAMARGSSPYSQGHQFFIMYGGGTLAGDSAGGYTVIGTVTGGLDKFISEIASKGIAGGSTDGAPVIPTTITSVIVN